MLVGSLLVVAGLSTGVVAWSPTNGIVPGKVSCPNTTLIRQANSISKAESEWLEKRHNHTDVALKNFLENQDLEDFDVDDFFDNLNHSINIAMAFSGGGNRAMLNGAGQLAAFDERVYGANESGLGGLLQATTYLAGISGGNWLTGTIAFNNFTSVDDILASDQIWQLSTTILDSAGWNFFRTFKRMGAIGDAIIEKEDKGFKTSIIDLWGRALSYNLFGRDHDGFAGMTYSSIRDWDTFTNGEMPFPISVADGREPGTLVINSNSTVFEFNPFELGSWDPSLNSFTDLKYVGTNVTNGTPVDIHTCYAGLDNAGFTLGTSAAIFNQLVSSLAGNSGIDISKLLSSLFGDILIDYFQRMSSDYQDIALYEPNPFFNSSFASSKSITTNETLYLVDGGEDAQGIPFAPFLQEDRNVDVIFAFDNSGDTKDLFPNGAALVATYERQFTTQGHKSPFPYVPDVETFLAQNLTSKPTFFGCDSGNLTNLTSIPPLVVYIPNTSFDYWSNTSTLKNSYTETEKRGLIKNGFEVSTRYNGTIDSSWSKCVACAIIRREEERNDEDQSAECEECFTEYCWNGEYASSAGNSTTTSLALSNLSGNYTSSRKIPSAKNNFVSVLY